MSRKYIILNFFLFLFIIFSVFVYFSLRPYYIFAQKFLGFSPLIFLLRDGDFKKTNDRVNLLLLGQAGSQYQGADLTDSIIVLSLDLKTKKIHLISVPRDVWSPTLKDRINSAYAYGAYKKRGGGFLLSKAEVSAIVGIPIHYGILLDFEKFKGLIDFLGGVEIDIERGFDDYRFPIPGREDDTCGKEPTVASDEAEYECRYEHISFKKGKQNMDGELALKFVRSRHATNEEGSDYARGRRQLKVINTVYEKLLSKIRSTDPAEFNKMYEMVDKLFKRDIKNQEVAYIAKKFWLAKDKKIQQIPLIPAFFEVPDNYDYDGKYVLIPKGGDYITIHDYIECRLNDKGRCESIKPKLE